MNFGQNKAQRIHITTVLNVSGRQTIFHKYALFCQKHSFNLIRITNQMHPLFNNLIENNMIDFDISKVQFPTNGGLFLKSRFLQNLRLFISFVKSRV